MHGRTGLVRRSRSGQDGQRRWFDPAWRGLVQDRLFRGQIRGGLLLDDYTAPDYCRVPDCCSAPDHRRGAGPRIGPGDGSRRATPRPRDHALHPRKKLCYSQPLCPDHPSAPSLVGAPASTSPLSGRRSRFAGFCACCCAQRAHTNSLNSVVVPRSRLARSPEQRVRISPRSPPCQKP